ncbi:MAG: RDD family protein [Planctomycetes bacterium]|nr:RDD family protein [Planctomycetota bacterium]
MDAVAFMFLMMFISPMLGLANATVAMVFGIGLVALHLVCIPVFYYAGFHAGGGQTPGKMFFGLKVVTMTGDTLGWRRSFVRALDPVVLLFAFAPLAVADQHALAWLFVVGYGVVNACCAAGSRYGRILHDRWAGSRLVLTRNDGQP